MPEFYGRYRLAIDNSLENHANDILQKYQGLSVWLSAQTTNQNPRAQALIKSISVFSALINRYYTSNSAQFLKNDFYINQTEYRMLRFLDDCINREQDGDHTYTYDKEKYEVIMTMLQRKKWTPFGYVVGAALGVCVYTFTIKTFSLMLSAALLAGAACPPLFIASIVAVGILALITLTKGVQLAFKAQEGFKARGVYSQFAEAFAFFKEPPPILEYPVNNSHEDIIQGIPLRMQFI